MAKPFAYNFLSTAINGRWHRISHLQAMEFSGEERGEENDF